MGSDERFLDPETVRNQTNSLHNLSLSTLLSLTQIMWNSLEFGWNSLTICRGVLWENLSSEPNNSTTTNICQVLYKAGTKLVKFLLLWGFLAPWWLLEWPGGLINYLGLSKIKIIYSLQHIKFCVLIGCWLLSNNLLQKAFSLPNLHIFLLFLHLDHWSEYPVIKSEIVLCLLTCDLFMLMDF